MSSFDMTEEFAAEHRVVELGRLAAVPVEVLIGSEHDGHLASLLLRCDGRKGTTEKVPLGRRAGCMG
jgi:hypothetical protein